MIIGYLFLGAKCSGSVGALSLTYGVSGALGYFGLADAPIVRLTRVNAISGVGALLGLGSILTGGTSLAMFALTALHLFDLYQGAISEDKSSRRSSSSEEFERVGQAAGTATTSPETSSSSASRAV